MRPLTDQTVVLTLDQDWAPDFIMESVSRVLVEARLPATFFITHESEVLQYLRAHSDLFELGIHPNFLQGSSHGDTVQEVLSHIIAIVPEAVSTRSHSVVQSGRILEALLRQTNIGVDSSIFLPEAEYVRPFLYEGFGRQLTRVPFVWTDDYELGKKTSDWDIHKILGTPGVKVFDFHPTHIYLNSIDWDGYEPIRRGAPRLQELRPALADDSRRVGRGVGSFFADLIDYMRVRNLGCQLAALRIE